MKHFFKNIKTHKTFAPELIFYIFFGSALVVFYPIFIIALFSIKIELNLESIVILLFVLFMIIVFAWMILFISKTAMNLLRGLSQEIKPQQLKIKQKKTIRGRNGTTHFLFFIKHPEKHFFRAGSYKFNKLKKGQSYKFLLLKRSKMVIPVK